MRVLNIEAGCVGESTCVVFPIAGDLIEHLVARGFLYRDGAEILIDEDAKWGKDDLAALLVSIRDGQVEPSAESAPVACATGIDHERTALIEQAARWIVFNMPTIPGPTIFDRLRRNFGLTGEDAADAVREASVLAGSVSQQAARIAERAR